MESLESTKGGRMMLCWLRGFCVSTYSIKHNLIVNLLIPKGSTICLNSNLGFIIIRTVRKEGNR